MSRLSDAEALEELAATVPLPTLARQGLRDRADVLRAADAAWRAERASPGRAARLRWVRWRRAALDWPCHLLAPYCPHRPACRNLVDPSCSGCMRGGLMRGPGP